MSNIQYNISIGRAENGSDILLNPCNLSHLLVCGLPESGKTSFVQSVFSSLILQAGEKDVKLIIYDSKITEYVAFGGLPHLLIPIISDRTKFNALINWTIAEIKHRLQQMAESACRDYKSYNMLVEGKGISSLPDIFIIVDDFSTLLFGRDEFRNFIYCLSNGRVAGVHMIIISSLPSTRAIQKQLITNIPNKALFRMSSRAESRAHINTVGAEKLRIPGEMIFRTTYESFCCRSTYVPPEQIDSNLRILHEETTTKSMAYQYDDLIPEAAGLILSNQKCSIGLLQRKLKIGFNRAAEVIDQLEDLGLVGPENGIMPRDIKMNISQWNSVCDRIGIQRPG